MSADFLIPLIASLGWLVVAGAALASYRLKWSQLAKMAFVWLAIFGGLYVLVEWYLAVRDTTVGPSNI